MRVPLAAEAPEKGVQRVAGQASEGDGPYVGEDFRDLGFAVVLAQVLDRRGVDPVEVLGVVLGKEDRRRLGGILCRQRLVLLAAGSG